MQQTVTLQAFAKVNLSLEVVGKRADGYHELRSVAQCISLADTIALRQTSRAVVLHTTGYEVPAGAENLAWQAATAFMAAAGEPSGVEISLVKRIPPGRGLGGGSSDAAAMLTGLAALAAQRLPAEALPGLAAELGSDVPLFLSGGSLRMAGRGEILQSLPGWASPPIMVIAWPQTTVPTVQAYRLLRPQDFTTGAQTERLVAQIKAGQPLRDIDLHNCFERPVLEHWPAVARVHRRLSDALGSKALLAGSGSAVLGLAPDREAARAAADALAGECPAVVVEPVAVGNTVI